MFNPLQIPLLNPLNSQRRNKRRSNTTPILRRPNINWIPLALRPIQDLTQSLRASNFEMWVFIEDGTIGANVAGFDILFLADCGDAARGEAGGACAD